MWHVAGCGMPARWTASLPARWRTDSCRQVMPPSLAGSTVDVEPRGRENPLPQPLAAGARILAGQGPRKLDPAGGSCQVGLVLAPYPLEVLGEGGLATAGMAVGEWAE